MAKRTRVKPDKQSNNKYDECPACYECECEECEHSWHLVNFWKNPFEHSVYEASFVCDKCGIMKVLPKRN